MAISSPSAPTSNLASGAQASADSGQEQVNWLLARARGAQERPYHYLLLLRFVLINLLGLGLLGAAHAQGWVEMVVQADASRLSIVIALVFVVGLGYCALRVFQTSSELNHIKSFDPLVQSAVGDYIAKLRGRGGESRSMLSASLRMKLSQRISLVRHIAGSLVLLGLIGTVIGFIIALSGVDPESASDVQSIAPMVSSLIEGLSTALYTTLIGSVLNVWLMINYRLLAGGTVKLITALIDFGEDNARA